MSSLIIISETPHALKLSLYLSALLNHSQNEVVQTKGVFCIEIQVQRHGINTVAYTDEKSTPGSVNYKSTINSPSRGFSIAMHAP